MSSAKCPCQVFRQVNGTSGFCPEKPLEFFTTPRKNGLFEEILMGCFFDPRCSPRFLARPFFVLKEGEVPSQVSQLSFGLCCSSSGVRKIFWRKHIIKPILGIRLSLAVGLGWWFGCSLWYIHGTLTATPNMQSFGFCRSQRRSTFFMIFIWFCGSQMKIMKKVEHLLEMTYKWSGSCHEKTHVDFQRSQHLKRFFFDRWFIVISVSFCVFLIGEFRSEWFLCWSCWNLDGNTPRRLKYPNNICNFVEYDIPNWGFALSLMEINKWTTRSFHSSRLNSPM